MEIKPGFLTSENAYTLVINIFACLVILGVVTPDEGEMLVELVTKVISGVIALVTTAMYIKGRVDLKKHSMMINGLVEALPVKEEKAVA